MSGSDDMSAMYALTVDLGATRTPADVADVILVHLVRAAGAVGGSVYLDSGGDSMSLLRELGPAGDGQPPLTLPLETSGRLVGTVLVRLAADTSPEPLTDARAELLAAMAAQGALALDRANLYLAALAAQERAERSREVFALLAGSSTVSEVVRAALDSGLAALGATAGLFALREDSQSEHLLLADSSGYDTQSVRDWRQVPLDAETPLSVAVRTGRPVFLASRTETIERFPLLAAALEDRTTSMAAVPLRTSGSVLGALGLSFDAAQPFDDAQRSDLVDFAGRCADAIVRSKEYERQRDIVLTMQRALLPTRLPDNDNVALAARYVPGTKGIDVGGDWYDAIAGADGRILLVVGDVVGRGIDAAVAMGQLRSAFRAVAGRGGPASILTELDHFVDGLPAARFATVACVLVDPKASTLTYALAGHPPPLLRDGRQVVRQLGRARTLPLGIPTSRPRVEEVVPIDGSAHLFLYTDGLVERRGEVLDVGVDRAAVALRTVSEHLEQVCDDVFVAALPVGGHDDVVALCARIVPDAMPFEAHLGADHGALGGIRRELRTWLERLAVVQHHCDDLVLAFGEASSNAVEHGGEPIRVDGRLEGESIVITVRDSGTWITRPRLTGRGRGLQIMRSLCDTVDVRHEPGGTAVELCRTVERGGLVSP